MIGLLKETTEIEKLQQEFKILICTKQKQAATSKEEEEELILEECEL